MSVSPDPDPRYEACEFCGKLVDTFDRYAYHRIVGYARKGKAGGSDIVLRRPLGGWAHSSCVELEKANVNVGQESLPL